MNPKFVASLLIALTLIVSGCHAGQKLAAESSIRATEEALVGVQDEAAKYVPDQLKDIQTSLAAAKSSVASGEYEVALNTAKDLVPKAKELGDAILAKKKELTAKWADLSGSAPQEIADVQQRVTSLRNMHKLPEGTQGRLEEIQRTWTAASDAQKSGNLMDCISKATSATEELEALQEKLGMHAHM